MVRRSSSNSWLRPATGKQISALKAHGNYDGKYYSMGRASQAIGRSSSSSSSGLGYSSPLLSSGTRLTDLFAQSLSVPDDLDSLLQPSLGQVVKSPLVSSDSGPTGLLSDLLGVPDDLDSLLHIALEGVDSDDSATATGDDPVESVSFTVRSDEFSSSNQRIAVDAEVIRDSDFDGKPSLQVRFVGNTEHGEELVSGRTTVLPGARKGLRYRPIWTPVLVREPRELAEQMRAYWVDAIKVLDEGIDPRMAMFLAGFSGMESALAVLNSSESSVTKFILLQGLLDPDGPIQFQGLRLEAATVADQVRVAQDGGEAALSWLEDIQRERVLTSYAELTGTSLLGEADFRLTRWLKQGEALINAVTNDAEISDSDLSIIRNALTLRTRDQVKIAEVLAMISEGEKSSDKEIVETWRKFRANFERNVIDTSTQPDEYGLNEDWFYEETKTYLRARFRRSVPGQFAAALTPPLADRGSYTALAANVRRLANESSTDPDEYSVFYGTRDVSVPPWILSASQSSRGQVDTSRTKRLVQAVRCAITAANEASEDDLGTLIVAQEILTYAKWKRDELRLPELLRKLSLAAAQRLQEAQQRADDARLRAEEASKNADTARKIELVVEEYTGALAGGLGSINLRDPVPELQQSVVHARIEKAKLRRSAAEKWLAAAEKREQRVSTELEFAASRSLEEQLSAALEDAVTEQSDAKAERQAARVEHQEARSDSALLAEATTKFEELIQPVREENQRRLQEEAERQRQELQAKAERQRQELQAKAERQRQERRRQAEREEKLREKRAAANRRQEELNQRQQDRARAAKDALTPELKKLLALPDSAFFWRRKALAETRAMLHHSILKCQTEIGAPLFPPRTESMMWPQMLNRTERYLGTVKKLTSYGVFVSLPAGVDGLLSGSEMSASLSQGQLVVVEIVDMPFRKPIALKLISR